MFLFSPYVSLWFNSPVLQGVLSMQKLQGQGAGIMRIAVAGKGGAGKTTISATMARLFAQRGFRVNALDDDPNPNLANALGLTASQVEQLRGIARENIMEERVDASNHASLHLTLPFDQVIENYGVVGPDGVRMLMMTALQGAGKG